MTAPVPFSISVDDAILADLRDRISRYPWADLPDAGGWHCGTSLAYLYNLSRYWLDGYDWRVEEAKLNLLPHFRADVGGFPLHFIHVEGSGAKNPPLLLSHGWPGSFFEFAEIVEPLAHPERFGGDPADGFDVVVPSLPGYGFSGRPARPIGPRTTAQLFNALMTRTLGYESYLAQGGDWGAVVTGWLGYRHADTCRAIHLNMIGLRSREMTPVTESEKAWDAKYQALFRQEGAYLQLQATKPQSLAFAMMDSPVGIAAWILEKFGAWSHVPRDPLGSPALGVRYSEDQLLTNIMIYLVTKSFATSTWMYRGFFDEQPIGMDPGTRVAVPTGVAAFPDPVYGPPPRSLVERGYNVTHWTDMPRGGHFAAMEEPGLFVEDLRKFARTVR
jgi:pimeloyl-ACP methyl ester carboxylesterase